MPSDSASLPLSDLSFSRGYGAFESLRTYSGVPFLVKGHVERLLETGSIMRIRHKYTPAKILSAIKASLTSNPPGDKLIRIFLTGGDGSGLVQNTNARLIICVDPFKPFPTKQYTEGVKLWPHSYVRTNPEAKSTNYSEAVIATSHANSNDFDEAVYTNFRGELTEAQLSTCYAIQQKAGSFPINVSCLV